MLSISDYNVEEAKLELKKPKKLKKDKESNDKEIKRIPRINFIHEIHLEVVKSYVEDFREIFESLKNFIETPEELKYLEEDLKFFDEEIDKFKALVFTAIRESTSKFDKFIIDFLKNIYTIDLQREYYIVKDGGQVSIDKEGWERLLYIFDMFNQNLFISLDSIVNDIKMTILEGINNSSEHFIEPLNNIMEKIKSLESIDLDSWKTQAKLDLIFFEDSTLLVSIIQAISTYNDYSIIILFIEGLERQLMRKTGDRLSEFQRFALDLKKIINNMSNLVKKIYSAKSEEDCRNYNKLWSEYFLFSINIYKNNEIPHYLTDIQLTFKEIEGRSKKDKIKKEQIEKKRLKREWLMKEQLRKEQWRKEQLRKERLRKERLEKERVKKERIEKEHMEKERQKRILEREKQIIEKNRIKKLKVKNAILELGTKFTRLQISEISEKTELQDDKLIVDTILEMIKNREINAEFFRSSNSVVFDQRTNLEEISKLRESISPAIIVEQLKEVKGHCKNCGNKIVQLGQKICEYCGEELK